MVVVGMVVVGIELVSNVVKVVGIELVSTVVVGIELVSMVVLNNGSVVVSSEKRNQDKKFNPRLQQP